MGTTSMPSKPLKGFISSRSEWRFQYNGQEIAFPCKKMGWPLGKTESAPYARQAKQEWIRKINAKALSPDEVAKQWADTLFQLSTLPDCSVDVDTSEFKEMNQPEEVKRLICMAIMGKDRYLSANVRPERLLHVSGPINEEETTAFQVSAYIAHLPEPSHGRQKSPKTIVEYTRHIRWIASLPCLPTSIRDFSRQTVVDVHNAIASLDTGGSDKNLKLLVFMLFVEFACDALDIVRPTNLRDRKWAFPTDTPKDIVWTPEEFQADYAKLEGVERLILLLAANTGIQPCDMAKLDYEGNGTITLKREKKKGKGPTVTFTLWPETAELLVKHGEELKTLYKDEWVDGKREHFNRISRRMNQKLCKPLCKLRNTSDTFIGLPESEFVVWGDDFLADSPRTMRRKHYDKHVILPPALFDYLYRCYFGK